MVERAQRVVGTASRLDGSGHAVDEMGASLVGLSLGMVGRAKTVDGCMAGLVETARRLVVSGKCLAGRTHLLVESAQHPIAKEKFFLRKRIFKLLRAPILFKAENMDNKTRVPLNMQNTVSVLMDDYQDVVLADPDLVASEQIRQNHLGRARVAARKAFVETPANTENKEAEKQRVIRELFKPMGRVQAWAARTENAAVTMALDTNYSTLDDLPDADVVGALEGLMTTMRGVIAEVPTVPVATLDALDDEIDGLPPLLGSTRNLMVDRQGAKAELEREMRAARVVLETQHDKIVLSYEHANPATPAEQRQREFFDRWDPARKLVDAATTSEVPAGGSTAAVTQPESPK